MRLQTVVALTLIFLAGCGRLQSAATTAGPQDDALEEVKEAVAEALDAIRESTAPHDPEDVRDATNSVPLAIKGVVTAAQVLVKAAAGTPMEVSANGILNDAQGLEEQAAGPVSQLTQGLQDLRAKVAALIARK